MWASAVGSGQRAYELLLLFDYFIVDGQPQRIPTRLSTIISAHDVRAIDLSGF